MSEEQLNAFLEKVKGDTSLQEKLKAAGSNEAAIEIAKEAGFSITAEDIQSMQLATVELSDEELEGASGGVLGGVLRQRELGALSGNCPTGGDWCDL
jgi:predicted ribosomally synthesized peptide with nif11-like leader